MTTTLATSEPIAPPSPVTGYAFTRADIDRATASRIARAEEQRGNRALELTELKAKRAFVDALVAEWELGDIGQAGLVGAMQGIAHLAEALPALEINTSLDAVRVAQTVEILFKIHRLATGQSTSNAAALSVDVTELASRKAELLARLNAPVSE